MAYRRAAQLQRGTKPGRLIVTVNDVQIPIHGQRLDKKVVKSLRKLAGTSKEGEKVGLQFG